MAKNKRVMITGFRLTVADGRLAGTGTEMYRDVFTF
jgi:hypothetical protein